MLCSTLRTHKLLNESKASKDVALKAVKKLVEKYNLTKIIQVLNEGRFVVATIDKDALQVAFKYDGCYCLKTDLPNELANKERVHKRYKQLIQVNLHLEK